MTLESLLFQKYPWVRGANVILRASLTGLDVVRVFIREEALEGFLATGGKSVLQGNSVQAGDRVSAQAFAEMLWSAGRDLGSCPEKGPNARLLDRSDIYFVVTLEREGI